MDEADGWDYFGGGGELDDGDGPLSFCFGQLDDTDR